MTPKESYLHYCAKAIDLPLFFQPAWLDLSGLSWHVLLTHDALRQSVFFVYTIEKKMGFRFIRNPHFTPYTGLLLSSDADPESARHLTSFIDELPPVDVLELDLLPAVANTSLPASFHTSLRRTNILALQAGATQLYQAFKPALKRQIRKAEASLKVSETSEINRLYKLYKKTFQKQSLQPTIPLEVFLRYAKASFQMQCAKIYLIQDADGRDHAGIWVVWDNQRMYYLCGGSDPAFYGSGAMPYALWVAIQLAIDKRLEVFDFEGSMLAGVNRFFQNYSPEEKSYVHISCIRSTLYRWWKNLKQV